MTGVEYRGRREILRFFDWEHLPERLQLVSRPFQVLAETMNDTLPHGDELTVGLRKLLEAKDCAVRAALGQNGEQWRRRGGSVSGPSR